MTFEDFWIIYDKKIAKKKCLVLFGKLSIRDRVDIMSALPLYIANTPDKQYRKNPLTYLQGECWNDEIIIKKDDKFNKDNSINRLQRW